MILTQRQIEKMGLDEEPAKKRPAVRFGARQFRADDGLSTKPAPPPKGPPTDQLLADAARRRREQRERDRD